MEDLYCAAPGYGKICPLVPALLPEKTTDRVSFGSHVPPGWLLKRGANDEPILFCPEHRPAEGNQ